MRPLFVYFFISALLIGCGTTRTTVSPFDPFVQLRKDINSILSDSLFIPTRTGVKVVSLDNGKIFYERDSKMLMNPASNIKLFTSGAALSMLDTNYQFKTSVFLDYTTLNGSVANNIYLKGYGDPDLTDADLDSLVWAVGQSGIVRVTKNIIIDDSFFDDDYWGPGWVWDDESYPDAPYISALSVNKNCINVTLLSDSKTSYVYLDPMTDFVTVINRANISNDSIRFPANIKRLFSTNTNMIVAEGEIPSYSQIMKKFAIRSPKYYAGTLFKESLRHIGIAVDGDVISGIVPEGLKEIAQNYRHIEDVVTNMNKVSDNLSAENILKVLGSKTYDCPGSSKSGTWAVKQFLYNLGIDTTKLCIVDGSGVSRYNLVSAEQLVQFLAAMYRQPRIFPMFYNSLPIAAVDGTISERMMASPVATNVRAKTGTLNGVSCLSGYVRTHDGELLAFSIMMQNYITSAYDYRNAQDKICTLLSSFSKKRPAARVFHK